MADDKRTERLKQAAIDRRALNQALMDTGEVMQQQTESAKSDTIKQDYRHELEERFAKKKLDIPNNELNDKQLNFKKGIMAVAGAALNKLPDSEEKRAKLEVFAEMNNALIDEEKRRIPEVELTPEDIEFGEEINWELDEDRIELDDENYAKAAPTKFSEIDPSKRQEPPKELDLDLDMELDLDEGLSLDDEIETPVAKESKPLSESKDQRYIKAEHERLKAEAEEKQAAAKQDKENQATEAEVDLDAVTTDDVAKDTEQAQKTEQKKQTEEPKAAKSKGLFSGFFALFKSKKSKAKTKEAEAIDESKVEETKNALVTDDKSQERGKSEDSVSLDGDVTRWQDEIEAKKENNKNKPQGIAI